MIQKYIYVVFKHKVHLVGGVQCVGIGNRDAFIMQDLDLEIDFEFL